MNNNANNLKIGGCALRVIKSLLMVVFGVAFGISIMVLIADNDVPIEKKITLSVVLFIAFIVVSSIDKIISVNKKKKSILNNLNKIDGFVVSQHFIGEDGKSGIAFDEKRHKICLIKLVDWKNNIEKYSKGEVEYRVVTYGDLVSAEIYEDGVSQIKTSRLSQAGGAIAGGLLFGGVGAVIGGLSGSKSVSDKIKRIDLRLIINNTESPIHDINFMNVESKKGGFIYNPANELARHWHALLGVLIKRADDEYNNFKESAVTKTHDNHYVADELTKLSQLKEQGLLSEAEFAAQKAKLLL